MLMCIVTLFEIFLKNIYHVLYYSETLIALKMDFLSTIFKFGCTICSWSSKIRWVFFWPQAGSICCTTWTSSLLVCVPFFAQSISLFCCLFWLFHICLLMWVSGDTAKDFLQGEVEVLRTKNHWRKAYFYLWDEVRTIVE